jgi:hypothetical protein
MLLALNETRFIAIMTVLLVSEDLQALVDIKIRHFDTSQLQLYILMPPVILLHGVAIVIYMAVPLRKIYMHEASISEIITDSLRDKQSANEKMQHQ